MPPRSDPTGPGPPSWLPEVLKAADLREVAAFGLAAVADLLDATEAALWLEGADPSERGFRLHPNADSMEVEVVPPGSPDFERLAALHEEGWSRGGGMRPRTADGSGWVCFPIDIPGEKPGSLLAGPGVRPDGTPGEAVHLAAIMGMRAAELSRRAESSGQRKQFTRWFETMDAQIRVLERERQKLASLLNKSEAGALVLGTDYMIRWANPAVTASLAKAGPAALRGKHCNSLCGNLEGVCSDCPTQAVLDRGKAVHLEKTRSVDGEVRHYYISGFPIRTPKGDVEEILVTIQDLTDLETLRRSEARYQLLFERSADAIVVAGTGDLRVIMANPRARSLLGLGNEAAASKSLLDLHPAAARDTMEAHYRDLSRGLVLNDVEMEVIAADGSMLTCNAYGTLFDLDGEDGILMEYRDVTQIRRLQGELARADHLITLGTMNAGIAHEFKNRLAPLRAFAQLLTLEGYDNRRLEAHTPMIIREVDRLTGLVRDVLDYARPHAPRIQTLDLVSLCRDMAEELCTEFENQMLAAGVICEKNLPEDEELPVTIDPEQVRRAVINIIKNGMESFENCPAPRPTVRLTVRRRGSGAELEFRDNGCGIETGDLPRIFDPFFSTKGTRGTGLGMCIVKSLIEANGGTIEVSSRPGEGTTVLLGFPMADPHIRREAA